MADFDGGESVSAYSIIILHLTIKVFSYANTLTDHTKYV